MNKNMSLKIEYLIENKNKIILYLLFILTLFLMLLGLRNVFELKDSFPIVVTLYK